MNFMSGLCLARYGRFSFWTSPCLCAYIKPNNMVNRCKDIRIKYNAPVPVQLCKNKKYAISRMTYWTQVRFYNSDPKNTNPTLHRDMEFPNFDSYRKDQFKNVTQTKWNSADNKIGISYVMGFFGFVCGAYGVKSEMLHFIYSMAAAADVRAMATIEIDISKVAPGRCLSFKWRGKPLFVKNRTTADIALEAETPLSSLRDPETPEQRTIKPEWLVVIGICTHLGCVPIPNSGDWSGGFYCPCHGSHYDNVGRARKGPAPLNLVVPPYKFLTDTVLLIG